MDELADGPLVVHLPERMDRRMRLGPFPSSRDAFKFTAYAAVAALLSPFASPWIWISVVLTGFLISVWRPDGQALDERALAVLNWRLRANGPRGGMTGTSPRPLLRQGLLHLGSGRYVAMVRTGGTPVAYLPPGELARRFELYRELLRSTETGFAFLATTIPIRSRALQPDATPPADAASEAFTGYGELVNALCRRRLLRRVYFVMGTTESDLDAVGRLEGRLSALLERLEILGLRPVRLRDRALAEAARRFGWAVEVGRS